MSEDHITVIKYLFCWIILSLFQVQNLNRQFLDPHQEKMTDQSQHQLPHVIKVHEHIFFANK